MYNPALVQASFAKLVGFLQPNDPNTPSIPTGSDLLVSNSGIYLQNIHPLCTIDNLYYAAPDFTITKWAAWLTGSNYAAGAVVNYSGALYRAVNAIVGSVVNPVTAGVGVWAVYTPFINWLVQFYNQSSSNFLGEVVKRKKLLKMGKPILEKQQLYRGYGQQNNTIVKLGRAVGFEIKPAAVDGLLMQIDSIGMQLSQAQTEINWYLYHSSQLDAIQVFHLAIAAQDFTWQALTDCILGFKTNGTDTSGVFYLVYYEDDLTGQAISKTWDFTAAPCIGCDGVNAAMYNKWSAFTTIRTIEVAANYLDPGRNLFNVNFISYNTNSNYGANLSISVKCDLTATVTENRLVFSDGFAKQLALEALKFIAYSSRVNPFNDKINKMAMADLDPKVSGAYINEWSEGINAVSLDLSGFSKSCLPDDNTSKMKCGSI